MALKQSRIYNLILAAEAFKKNLEGLRRDLESISLKPGADPLLILALNHWRPAPEHYETVGFERAHYHATASRNDMNRLRMERIRRERGAKPREIYKSSIIEGKPAPSYEMPEPIKDTALDEVAAFIDSAGTNEPFSSPKIMEKEALLAKYPTTREARATDKFTEQELRAHFGKEYTHRTVDEVNEAVARRMAKGELFEDE